MPVLFQNPATSLVNILQDSYKAEWLDWIFHEDVEEPYLCDTRLPFGFEYRSRHLSLLSHDLRNATHTAKPGLALSWISIPIVWQMLLFLKTLFVVWHFILVEKR